MLRYWIRTASYFHHASWQRSHQESVRPEVRYWTWSEDSHSRRQCVASLCTRRNILLTIALSPNEARQWIWRGELGDKPTARHVLVNCGRHELMLTFLHFSSIFEIYFKLFKLKVMCAFCFVLLLYLEIVFADENIVETLSRSITTYDESIL